MAIARLREGPTTASRPLSLRQLLTRCSIEQVKQPRRDLVLPLYFGRC
jgi:hypothetical protein